MATGAEACERALQLLGVRRLGIVTPYQAVGDQNVVRFFNERGFDVVNICGLRCPTAVSIAHVQEATLRQALLEVNTPDVEALVQVGTNPSMVALADEAERWLDKPVIAITPPSGGWRCVTTALQRNSTAVAASYGSFEAAASLVCPWQRTRSSPLRPKGVLRHPLRPGRG